MAETLRIAQVAPYLTPHVGGVESHVEGISAELAKRGHDVEVLTSRLPGTPRQEIQDGYLVRRVATRAMLWRTPITPRLGEVLNERRHDLVHAHSPPPLSAYYAAAWCRRTRTPLVYTYHCDLEIPMPGGWAIVGAYRRTLGRATVKASDIVVATTRTYAETSHALWSHNDVRVVPNAVDAERFHPRVDGTRIRHRHQLGDKHVALFVGRLAHHKGIEDFIRAAEWSGDDAVHLVVGDGPKREALEKLALSRFASKVVFAGKVDARDLPAYYRAADMGVLPSNSRLEAFGIAALECMASERPVIVSDIPGVTEVIQDGSTGLLAEPLDARDLGLKIKRLVDDDETAAAMGRAGRQRVLDHFTMPRVVDQLERVYAEALDARATAQSTPPDVVSDANR